MNGIAVAATATQDIAAGEEVCQEAGHAPVTLGEAAPLDTEV